MGVCYRDITFLTARVVVCDVGEIFSPSIAYDVAIAHVASCGGDVTCGRRL